MKSGQNDLMLILFYSVLFYSQLEVRGLIAALKQILQSFPRRIFLEAPKSLSQSCDEENSPSVCKGLRTGRCKENLKALKMRCVLLSLSSRHVFRLLSSTRRIVPAPCYVWEKLPGVSLSTPPPPSPPESPPSSSMTLWPPSPTIESHVGPFLVTSHPEHVPPKNYLCSEKRVTFYPYYYYRNIIIVIAVIIMVGIICHHC